MYLGKIKDNVSSLVKNKLGINIENYNISIKTDFIKHALKVHTNLNTEHSRGEIPIAK